MTRALVLRIAMTAAGGALVVGALASAPDVPVGSTPAEQAAAPTGIGRPLAGHLDAGDLHTCAVLDDDTVRCWGFSEFGQLGYANTDTIGDNELPGGPIDLGTGRTATAVTAGANHTCALLDDASVRCWGNGGFGQLGYGNTDTIGDNETPGSAGPVDLGTGRTAVAVRPGPMSTGPAEPGVSSSPIVRLFAYPSAPFSP